MEREIKEFRVVADEGFSRRRRSDIVSGTDLIEVFEDGGLLPHFIVELAVDHRRLIEPWNANGLGFLRRNGDEVLACAGRGNGRWRCRRSRVAV